MKFTDRVKAGNCRRRAESTSAEPAIQRTAGARSLSRGVWAGVTGQRVFDAASALIAGLIASPVMVGVGLAVWATLGRPILFRQVRVGRGGVPFEIVKFRTMTNERDASGHLLPDETRAVPLGRFLRRTRLDELPQLLNVLRGDMSIVGPRSLPGASMASLGSARDRRIAVRPGLTGWAQVNGNTRLTDIEKLSLDIWYIDHRSVALDLIILFRTAVVIARGERVVTRHLKEARAHALRSYGLG
jgi:lipopolysaccharide/colanic/teichoic acid biosynthesis glycosyltransferase